MKLDKARQKFVDFLKRARRASATILAYTKDIAQLVEFLKEKKITDTTHVSRADIEAFMAKLSKNGYTLKSISRKTNATKTFFKFLKTEGITKDDPASLVAHPKFETKPPRTLTPLEYRALRDASRHDPRVNGIVEILLQTGIRISELANLRVGDVVFADETKEGSLYIRPIEGHPERTIPLNKAVEAAISKYLQVRPKISTSPKTKPAVAHLFVTKSGRPFLIRNIRTVIDRYFKKAGITGAKVNDLRHTWVVHHLSKGVSVVLVSKLAGHKRLSTTERYLSLIKEKAKEEKVKLEEL